MGNESTFIASVDIIIPFHGQYERVTKLIESIYRLTRSNYFTLCLVDDCSPNADYLGIVRTNITKTSTQRHNPNSFLAIRNEEWKGFGASCQAGWKQTESPYVCFLNSDCLIEDSNWLRAMGEALLKLKPQGVRLVSAMTNNSVGGHPAQREEKDVRSVDHVILGKGEHLTLYAFMCHRQLFERCGGFIRSYPYGGYEDQEFAARMQHYNFKQAVCRNAWIHHEGECTFRSIMKNNPPLVAEIEHNRERCISDLRALYQAKSK